jgi:hypothetical protein
MIWYPTRSRQSNTRLTPHASRKFKRSRVQISPDSVASALTTDSYSPLTTFCNLSHLCPRPAHTSFRMPPFHLTEVGLPGIHSTSQIHMVQHAATALNHVHLPRQANRSHVSDPTVRLRRSPKIDWAWFTRVSPIWHMCSHS